jgi:hypothetical protein
VDIRIEFSHQLWWNTGEHGRASRLNMQVVTLQQHPVATLGSTYTSSAWFFERDSQLMEYANPRYIGWNDPQTHH